MPFKDPDPTDPNMLIGVMLPADADATRDMVYVFAEEFVRFGYTREQLLWLFKNPFYGGAHGAYQTLGENETLVIIDECLNVWGGIKVSVQDVPTVQVAGEKERGRAGDADNPQSEFNFRNDFNGAVRLNRLNDLNARGKEPDDE